MVYHRTVTWMEDRLVLTRLIHPRYFWLKLWSFSHMLVVQYHPWLAGSHIPGIDVPSGVILMGYNAASLITYILYYKYMSYKLGFKDPEKMKAYIEHKEKLNSFDDFKRK